MLLRATGMMLSSQVLTTLILFLRNIVIARLISIEDFGIASTFAILFAVVETLANMSIKKLLVQDPDGEDPQFENTLHAVQLLRGLIGTALTLLLARPFAEFMNTPDVVWAYQVMAVIPLTRCFLHLDMFRMQRRMQFRPFAVTMVVSPLLGMIAVGVVYLIRPDYQVMLWSIIVQQVMQVVLSHVVAERRFGLAWNMTYVRRAVRFGTPLLFNGLLLVIITNGERMVIGNQMDLVVLAWFSTAFLLATAPTRVLTNTASSLILPKLSARQNDPARFGELGLVALELTLLLGLWMAVGLALVGPFLLVGLFGERYAPGLEVLVLLGIGQAVRVARTGPNSIAMASGRTAALLWTGLVRALALPAAYAVLQMGYGVSGVAIVGMIFEALAYVLGLWLVGRQQKIPLLRAVPALAVFCAAAALVLVDLVLAPPTATLLDNFHGLQLALVLLALLAPLAMPQLRAWAIGFVVSARQHKPAE